MPPATPNAAALVERIKINAISRETRGGRVFWMKHRRWFARPVLAGADVFFRISGAPVRAIAEVPVWQQWEVESFLGLHGGEGFHACADGARAVAAEDLPGVNLTAHLDGDSLTAAMAAAAGRELRRAHAWLCPLLGAAWSHGDAHTGNFLYDAARDRARIIDFEMMHAPAIPADVRHADDLLAFLQDLLGRLSAERWLPCALAFLEAYGCPEIFARLRPLLALPPPGAARLWWLVRAGFPPRAELTRRLAALREALET